MSTRINSQPTVDNFRGMSFAAMSDNYLLEVFDELCEMTADSRPNCDDWYQEWLGCKQELLSRLAKAEAQ